MTFIKCTSHHTTPELQILLTLPFTSTTVQHLSPRNTSCLGPSELPCSSKPCAFACCVHSVPSTQNTLSYLLSANNVY